MKKRNVILKHPEIVAAVLSVDDEMFLKKNPYGYLANLKHPKIHADYIEFCKMRNHAKILSDEERFHFDNQCIKKYRPGLKKAVEEIEVKEGSGLIKIISTDSATGTHLYWDEGRKNEKGEIEEWLVKSPNREKPTDFVFEWIADPEQAVMRYTDTIYAALFSRVHRFFKKNTPVS